MKKLFFILILCGCLLLPAVTEAQQKNLFAGLDEGNYAREVFNYKGGAVVLFYSSDFKDDPSSERLFDIMITLARYYKEKADADGRRIKFCVYDYNKNIRDQRENRAKADKILAQYGDFARLPVVIMYSGGKFIDRMDGAPSSGYEQDTMERMRDYWITPLLLNRPNPENDGRIYKYQGSFQLKEIEELRKSPEDVSDLIDEVVVLYEQTGSPNVNNKKKADEYIAIFRDSLIELQDYNLMELDAGTRKTLSGAYNVLGLSLIKSMGDLSGGHDMYMISLSLDPENANVMMNLGIMYYKEYKDYERALKMYEGVLEIEPNNAMAKVYRRKCIQAIKRNNSEKSK